MVLGKRMTAIVSEIAGGVIADVGCDHGKVSIAAAGKESVKAVYAIDISPSSLQKVIDAKAKNKLDKIKPIVSDGLDVIKAHIDQVIIAGMGGNEIISILSKTNPLPSDMILVPHQDANKVRRYLSGKVGIKKDYIVEENNKFYPIIVTEQGTTVYEESELAYGKNAPKTAEYLAMLQDKRKRYTKQLAENNNIKSGLTTKLQEVEALCKQLEI